MHIHAELCAAFINAVAVNIVADGSNELYIKSKQAEIVRNVSADSAGAERHRPGV